MKDFAGKGTMRRRRGKSERSIRQKSDAPMDLAAYERCIESQVLKQGVSMSDKREAIVMQAQQGTVVAIARSFITTSHLCNRSAF
jgi:hypothetical protein